MHRWTLSAVSAAIVNFNCNVMSTLPSKTECLCKYLTGQILQVQWVDRCNGWTGAMGGQVQWVDRCNGWTGAMGGQVHWVEPRPSTQYCHCLPTVPEVFLESLSCSCLLSVCIWQICTQRFDVCTYVGRGFHSDVLLRRVIWVATALRQVGTTIAAVFHQRSRQEGVRLCIYGCRWDICAAVRYLWLLL